MRGPRDDRGSVASVKRSIATTTHGRSARRACNSPRCGSACVTEATALHGSFPSISLAHPSRNAISLRQDLRTGVPYAKRTGSCRCETRLQRSRRVSNTLTYARYSKTNLRYIDVPFAVGAAAMVKRYRCNAVLSLAHCDSPILRSPLAHRHSRRPVARISGPPSKAVSERRSSTASGVSRSSEADSIRIPTIRITKIGPSPANDEIRKPHKILRATAASRIDPQLASVMKPSIARPPRRKLPCRKAMYYKSFPQGGVGRTTLWDLLGDEHAGEVPTKLFVGAEATESGKSLAAR